MRPEDEWSPDEARRWWLSWLIVVLILGGVATPGRVVFCVPVRGFDPAMPPALLFCRHPDTGRPFIMPCPGGVCR